MRANKPSHNNENNSFTRIKYVITKLQVGYEIIIQIPI